MAIDLYSGTPGSGKSLHSAKDIIDCFRKGRPVVANFEVDATPYPKAQFTYCEDSELSPEFLADYSRTYFGGRKLTKRDEDTILLVIDECQLLFNSREYQKKDRKTWIKFFTQHRKFGYHVILIAQMDKMLDKQIRGVIEYEFIHRKLSNYGKLGKVVTFFLLGDLFTSVQMWYPLKMKVGSSMFRAKCKYYSLYDSYATFGDPKQAVVEPAQEDQSAAAPLPAPPEPKKTCSIKLPAFKLPHRKPKPPKEPKKPRRCAAIDGSYVRPWDKRSLVSNNGKFLRPGGRSETGWAIGQQKKA